MVLHKRYTIVLIVQEVRWMNAYYCWLPQRINSSHDSRLRVKGCLALHYSPWLVSNDCRWGQVNFPGLRLLTWSLWLVALKLKERVWEEISVMGTKTGGMETNTRAREQKKKRRVSGQVFNWLPAGPSPPAACLWRLRRCRTPQQTWACCHWHQWPGCWQLPGCSAGHHLMPPSVNTVVALENSPTLFEKSHRFFFFYSKSTFRIVRLWSDMSNLKTCLPLQWSPLNYCLCVRLLLTPFTLENPLDGMRGESVCKPCLKHNP